MTGPDVTVVAVRATEGLVIVDGCRVRWRIDPTKKSPTPNWRCDECGPSHEVACEHTATAAAHLAAVLFGVPVTVTTPKKETP